MRKQHANTSGKSPSLEDDIDEGELRFRSLADAIPQLMWIAKPDGRAEYCNQRWITYTGLTLQQVQVAQWWNRVLPQITHPNDLQLCLDRWTSILERGEADEVEYRLKRASDGVY